jgi:hypothetical protein
VESSYARWTGENGEYDPQNTGQTSWTHSYHPVIWFAWIFKGDQRTNGNIERRLSELETTYWLLDDDISKQVAEGKTALDRERFLGLIGDETARQRTSELMDSGVQAIYAYARAAVEPLESEFNDLPEQVLRLLGKLYKDRSDLLEVPVGQPAIDDGTKWRDWLHTVLAATGGDGVRAILDWDREIESLQDIAPDQPFWSGRLTHAMTLRTLQLARSSALDILISELAPYHAGGQVSGLGKWVYWDLAKTAWETGGMWPYSEEDVKNTIVQFLIVGGILQGPMGDGEEARVAADALGRAPSYEWAIALLQVAEGQTTEQDRRDLCFSTVAQMLHIPINTWLTSPDAAMLLKGKILSLIEDRSLVNDKELLELYSGIMKAFSKEQASSIGAQLTSDELVRIHNAFLEFMPTLTSADDRAIALDFFTWGLMQPDFVAQNEEAQGYFEPLTTIYVDWGTSTTFENSRVTEEEFGILYRYFGRLLGFGISWNLEPGEDGE